MPSRDLAIPVLPCRSPAETAAFYRLLGFEGGPHEFDPSYGILCRGDVELHFFTHKELVPEQSAAGCYIRVLDIERIHHEFSSAQLPRHGIPRMDVLENKPWGLREFAVVDPDGNLLRIGQVVKNKGASASHVDA
jgi:catechol 2,3-dioxygenase-like lactoylglutathione lyase family enzyme